VGHTHHIQWKVGNIKCSNQIDCCRFSEETTIRILCCCGRSGSCFETAESDL